MTGAWGLTMSAGPPADVSQPPALREGHIGGNILPLRECDGQDNPTDRPAHGYSSVYTSFCQEGKEPRERCHWVSKGDRKLLIYIVIAGLSAEFGRCLMLDLSGTLEASLHLF